MNEQVVDEAAWAAWLVYRKGIKKPLFEVSWPLARRKLARFGSQQMSVVEQSIENGWQGLFPLHESATVIDPDFNPQAPW